jgi:hypothetical protein
MALTTLFAISLRSPVIEPELSSRITTSFGLVAESIYHELVRKSYSSCPLLADESSGGHFIATTVGSKACGNRRNSLRGSVLRTVVGNKPYVSPTSLACR